MKKRLKANRCPEFDCRSKKRTKIDDEYINDLYKCDNCSRIYTPCWDPSKLEKLWYYIKNWITWKIPYRVKNLISKEKQNRKYEQLHDKLVRFFDSPEGRAELKKNELILQREAELGVGWFSPEEDKAWEYLNEEE